MIAYASAVLIVYGLALGLLPELWIRALLGLPDLRYLDPNAASSSRLWVPRAAGWLMVAAALFMLVQRAA
jgi:hypothetical protein